jgi:acylglycerol kinase
VTIVKTERVDEAKELAGLIEKTNVIAVAGGDGTLSEVVTGLLRREDASEAARMYPIGIIPIGNDNQFASSLLKVGKDDEMQRISQATMAIVKHRVEPKDVMEIRVIDTPTPASAPDTQEVMPSDASLINEAISPVSEGSQEIPVTEVPEEITEKPKRKPVYAMSGVRLGMFREALKRKADMSTILGDYFTTVWSFLWTDETIFKAEIRYTPPCPGCLKCFKEEPAKVNQNNSMVSRVMSVFRPRQAQEPRKPLIVNDDCGIWTSICVETPEFNIQPQEDGTLAMEIGKKLNTTDFIRQGLKLISNSKDTIDKKISFNEAEIIPVEAPEYCSIDGEEFEVRPFYIRVLKNKLFFFSPT